MKYVCTLITVADIEQSLLLYRDILGLEVEQDFGEDVGLKGGLTLHLNSHMAMLIDRGVVNSRTHSHELFFEEDDLENIYERIEGTYDIIHPITTQPWHQRVFRFYDADHHMIEIGESMQAVFKRLLSAHSKEEVLEMTGTTKEYLDACLES